MIQEDIRQWLTAHQDIAYRDFQSSLIPNIDKNRFIGVRTPDLRQFAKTVGRRDDVDVFLHELPHHYFDENQLHALLLSDRKDYASCVAAVSRFLPFVDNWATCDSLLPKVFRLHKTALLPVIDGWLKDAHPYTVRFGIGMLMRHYLDEDFTEVLAEKVCAVHSEEYYVRMMAAWYFATALAKQYDRVLPFLQQNRLDIWTHNKAIQKAIESRRLSPEQKAVLRQYKQTIR